jgi:hypothetical protein
MDLIGANKIQHLTLIMKVKTALKQIAKDLTFLFLQFSKAIMIVLKLVIRQN